jgi:hypothetical protein
MPITTISLGVPTTILQNVVYALPNRAALVLSSVALDVSQDGTTWVAAPSSTTGLQTAGVFIRCPTAGALVTVKPLG